MCRLCVPIIREFWRGTKSKFKAGPLKDLPFCDYQVLNREDTADCKLQQLLVKNGLIQYSQTLEDADITYALLHDFVSEPILLESVLEKAGVRSPGHRLKLISVLPK